MKWTCILAALLILSAAIPGGLRVQGVHEGYAQAYAAGENSTRTPIRHVVNIFLENHSFDNMFEIFPENRFTGNATLSSQLSRPLNLLNNTSILSMLHQVPYGCFTTPDPYEGYVQYHIDWAHGKMDGFLQGSGPQSLTYYTADQMAPEWDFAEEYAIADNYFAPQISESMPNHLYYIAGFSPVINDYGPPPYVPFSETIFGELQHYGISWGFYIMNASMPFPELAIVQGLAEHRQNIQSWAQFVQEARNGDLPAVSYLYSQGSFDDQGPPDNVLNGELFLLYVVDLLERSPEWNSTAIFITYDEFGGYYDQVPPPSIGGVQLGFRVPLIVISPYAKEDYISGTLMTHTSLIAFIDYNWRLPALNRLVALSNIPIDMFDFTHEYRGNYTARPPIVFGAQEGFPVPETIYFRPVNNTSGYNFTSLFPLEPQIPFSQLPYARYGSSDFNLSRVNSTVFVQKDTYIIPFYEQPLFYGIIVLVQVAVATAGYLRRRGGHGR